MFDLKHFVLFFYPLRHLYFCVCSVAGWVGGAFALWCNTWFYAVWASGFAWRHKKTGHRADRRHSVSQSNYATILSKTTNSNSRGELIKIHLPGSNQFFGFSKK